MTNKYDAMIQTLKNASNVGIFVHVNPDGDAIGSALAIAKFLINTGKNVTCISDNFDNPVPEKLRFLPNSELFFQEKPKSFDVSLAVDLGETHRIGNRAYEYFKKGKKILCIDHHQTSDTSFADVAIVEPNAVSTTQIIFKILTAWDSKFIDNEIAQCIYAGLLTDSGGFQFSATSEETFRIAAELKRFEFDSAETSRLLMRNVPLRAFLLTNRVLSKAQFFYNNKIAIAAFTADDFHATGTTEEDAEAVNSLINVSEVLIAATIVEIADKAYKVSIRSKGGISASACAKCFGGGGHFNAAGCRVYGYLEDCIQKLVDAAKDVID